jgi:DNA-binding XRE family transcriptional regulator
MKKIPHLSDADISRFWSYVDKNCDRIPALENPELYSHVKGNCWEWTGFKDKNGYGKFSVTPNEVNKLKRNERSFRVPRLAYKLCNDVDLEDKIACHHCDNPSCCNPDHIYPGTTKENVRDRDSRGRQIFNPAYGENTGSAKYKEVEIIEFWDLYDAGELKVTEICDRFNMQLEHAYTILSGKKWGYLKRHLTRKRRVKFAEEESIKEIFFRYWTDLSVQQHTLGDEYGLSQTQVGAIVRGEAHRHITSQIELPFKVERRKGKLSDEQVIEIFILRKTKQITQAGAAKKYGVAQNTINQITSGKTYSHLTKDIAIPQTA